MRRNNRKKSFKINKKILFLLIIAIVLVAVFTKIIISSKKSQNNNLQIDPELALAMEYGRFEPGSEIVEGTNNNVEFSAFFLKDIDGDEILLNIIKNSGEKSANKAIDKITDKESLVKEYFTYFLRANYNNAKSKCKTKKCKCQMKEKYT